LVHPLNVVILGFQKKRGISSTAELPVTFSRRSGFYSSKVQLHRTFMACFTDSQIINKFATNYGSRRLLAAVFTILRYHGPH